MIRGTCGICKHRVRLRKSGVLQAHSVRVEGQGLFDDHWETFTDYVECKGRGKKPTARE